MASGPLWSQAGGAQQVATADQLKALATMLDNTMLDSTGLDSTGLESAGLDSAGLESSDG